MLNSLMKLGRCSNISPSCKIQAYSPSHAPRRSRVLSTLSIIITLGRYNHTLGRVEYKEELDFNMGSLVLSGWSNIFLVNSTLPLGYCTYLSTDVLSMCRSRLDFPWILSYRPKIRIRVCNESTYLNMSPRFDRRTGDCVCRQLYPSWMIAVMYHHRIFVLNLQYGMHRCLVNSCFYKRAKN